MLNSLNLYSFPECSYEFKMTHCSDPMCWSSVLAKDYPRVLGPDRQNLTGYHESQLGVPVKKGTHRQDNYKEITGIDVGTPRPASSRNACPRRLYLIDTPCFHLQSQGGSLKDSGNVCKLEGVPLGLKDRMGTGALCRKRVSNGNHWWEEKELLPSFNIENYFDLLVWSWQRGSLLTTACSYLN